MYKRILVPLDGSKTPEQAVPHAELLSTALRLGVHLVRVTPTLAEFYGPMASAYYIPAGLFEDMEKEALGYLSAKADE